MHRHSGLRTHGLPVPVTLVCRMHAVFLQMDGGKIYLILELAAGGELFSKVVDAGRLTEDSARFYYRQMMLGVAYCHGRKLCHRDLKLENLLLGTDATTGRHPAGGPSLLSTTSNIAACRSSMLTRNCACRRHRADAEDH